MQLQLIAPGSSAAARPSHSWGHPAHRQACLLALQGSDLPGGAQLGQRAFVGLTAMDRNSPPDYCKSAEANLADARAFIQYVRQAARPLQHCLLSGRCSPPLT